MLHLYFGSIDKLIKMDDFIEYPDDLFDSIWLPKWVNDPLSRTIIHDIDKVNIPAGMTTEAACIESRLRIEDLCTGTKNLLLCRYYDGLNNMSMMGKNCYKYLMDIADERDVKMGCCSHVFLHDDVLKGRKVHFINTDEFVSTYYDFLGCVVQIVDRGGALND